MVLALLLYLLLARGAGGFSPLKLLMLVQSCLAVNTADDNYVVNAGVITDILNSISGYITIPEVVILGIFISILIMILCIVCKVYKLLKSVMDYLRKKRNPIRNRGQSKPMLG